MNKDQLEEFRYDVAHALLKQMSKGSQFQIALDRMLDILADRTEQELCEMSPNIVLKKKKPRNKKTHGF